MSANKSTANASTKAVVEIDFNAEFVKALVNANALTTAIVVGGQKKDSPRQPPRTMKLKGSDTAVLVHGTGFWDKDGNQVTTKKESDPELTEINNAKIKRVEKAILDPTDFRTDIVMYRLGEAMDIIRSIGLPTADSMYGINLLMELSKLDKSVKDTFAEKIKGGKVGSVIYDKDDNLKDPTIEILAFDVDRWIKFAHEYHALIKETFGMTFPSRSNAARQTTEAAKQSDLGGLFTGRKGKGKGNSTQQRAIPSPENSYDPTSNVQKGLNKGPKKLSSGPAPKPESTGTTGSTGKQAAPPRPTVSGKSAPSGKNGGKGKGKGKSK